MSKDPLSLLWSVSQYRQAEDQPVTNITIKGHNKGVIVESKVEDISNAYPGYSWQEALTITNQSQQSVFKVSLFIEKDSFLSEHLQGSALIEQEETQTHYSLEKLEKGIALDVPKSGKLELLTQFELQGETMENADQGQSGLIKYRFLVEEFREQTEESEEAPKENKTETEHTTLPQMNEIVSPLFLIGGALLLLSVLSSWLMTRKR